MFRDPSVGDEKLQSLLYLSVTESKQLSSIFLLAHGTDRRPLYVELREPHDFLIKHLGVHDFLLAEVVDLLR